MGGFYSEYQCAQIEFIFRSNIIIITIIILITEKPWGSVRHGSKLMDNEPNVLTFST